MSNPSQNSPDLRADQQTPTYWQTVRATLREQPNDASQQCPHCKGLGWVRNHIKPGHPGFGILQHCPTCGGDYASWLSNHCGLTKAELSLTFEHWRNPQDSRQKEQRIKARQAMKQHLESRTGLLSFWGDYGSGKTLALQILVNQARMDAINSLYAPLANILDHLRTLYDRRERTSSFWNNLLNVQVLAIDEATRFNSTPWAKEKLWLLIDTRYRQRKSHLTIIATNDNITKRLPTSEPIGYLFSRLREGTTIELKGDLRQNK